MSPRDVILQKLYDGELAPAEAEALRAELTAADREKLAALAELDQLIAGSVEATTAEALAAKPLDLWSGIAAQLPPEQAPAQVWPLAARRRRLAIRATAVMSALAMAASLLLLLRTGPASNHCDVEEIDVAGASATVLTVPGERGNDTTLIWVDHDDNDEWESL